VQGTFFVQACSWSGSPFNSDGRRSSTSMAITNASVYGMVPALLLMAPWHVPPGLPGLVSKQLRRLPHIGPSSHWPSRRTETLVGASDTPPLCERLATKLASAA
jgi:hypothetical protein